jgi:hypothetical protein
LPSGFTVCVVEILTTVGSSFSARSANPSGIGRAIAEEYPAGMASTNAAAATTAERRNRDVSNDTLFNSSQQSPISHGPVSHG